MNFKSYHDYLFNLCDKAYVLSFKNEKWKQIHQALFKLCSRLENNGFKQRTGMTQNQIILNHIKEAGSITQREALLDYSIQSLTKRISELRDTGVNIRTNFKKHPLTGQKYARYSLGR